MRVVEEVKMQTKETRRIECFLCVRILEPKIIIFSTSRTVDTLCGRNSAEKYFRALLNKLTAKMADRDVAECSLVRVFYNSTHLHQLINIGIFILVFSGGKTGESSHELTYKWYRQ